MKSCRSSIPYVMRIDQGGQSAEIQEEAPGGEAGGSEAVKTCWFPPTPETGKKPRGSGSGPDCMSIQLV